jgi:hypothetical protein
MKRLMFFAIVSCLTVALPALAAEQDVVSEPQPVDVASTEAAVVADLPTVDTEEVVETKKPDISKIPVDPTKPENASYPSCFVLDGTYCSPVNSFRLCQLAPFEPEACVCQSDNTWKCLWF